MQTYGLENVKTFDQLLPWLRHELGWPAEEGHFEFEDLTYDWDPSSDLGLKKDDVAHIREIHQLRPLVTNQPWGIFFVSLEDKKIPIGVLKRILGGLTLKKRQSANKAEQHGWALHDLIFISAHGASGERALSFLHFSEENGGSKKIILKELGWDRHDTDLKLGYVATTLKAKLSWPEDDKDSEAWRNQWTSAFSSEHGAGIRTARELTKRLAELASDIRQSANDVLAYESKDGPLTKIYDDFKQTIFHNLTPADFADMYAQTICYGLLAARISRGSGALVADDAALMAPLTQPFLKDLMETFLAVGGRKSAIDFNELGIDEVVETLQAADMDAVLLDFGNRNPNEDPVLHFYEHFLRDYDSIMREQRGVYYTPLPVVRFIVRGVDELLTSEFGLEDGLADTTTWGQLTQRRPEIKVPDGVSPDAPFVQILDPATGTGTFLVEVINRVEKKLKTKWRKEGKGDQDILALWNDYVPAHLLPRLNGFELMMAPYAIAHIKIGMKLHESGYQPKTADGPRVQVYLTNSLEEPTGFGEQSTMSFIADSLALEAKGADEAKANAPITIIVGNPPYSGHSMNNRIKWIVERVKDYRKEFPDLQKPGQGKWLQDDYVKFIRYCEHRLVKTGSGVLGFITNHAYLDNPTFKGMRKRLTEDFAKIHVYDLHGSTKKREAATDGGIDENVFAIQQGVAILFARRLEADDSSVHRADLFGTADSKKRFLENAGFNAVGFKRISVRAPQYIFEARDEQAGSEYEGFTAIPTIFSPNGDPAPGIVTTHDEFAISWSPDEAISKVARLCATGSEQEARRNFRLCSQSQWNYQKAKNALTTDTRWRQAVVPILYRPFDLRTTIYNSHIAVHRRDRVMGHLLKGNNIALITARSNKSNVMDHFFVSNFIVETKCGERTTQSTTLPLFLFPSGIESETRANIDNNFSMRLADETNLYYDSRATLELDDIAAPPDDSLASMQIETHSPNLNLGRGDLIKTFGPRDIFDYIYGVLHSLAYRQRYANFLRLDFPRIPMPGSTALFRELVGLGHRLVALHLLNSKVEPKLIQPETRFVARGHTRVDKGYPKCINGKVMINEECWFEDIRTDVWNFHIGGY